MHYHGLNPGKHLLELNDSFHDWNQQQHINIETKKLDVSDIIRHQKTNDDVKVLENQPKSPSTKIAKTTLHKLQSVLSRKRAEVIQTISRAKTM